MSQPTPETLAAAGFDIHGHCCRPEFRAHFTGGGFQIHFDQAATIATGLIDPADVVRIGHAVHYILTDTPNTDQP